jgi:prepilin-type N-terminal cleavage/methylation domain-containing protein
MIRHSQRGFSLLELMIVVAIILIISAIAIPNFFRARQNAYEASAAGFLHTLQAEQLSYRTTTGAYAKSFSELPGLGGTPASSDPGGGAAGGASGGSLTSGGPTSSIIRNSYIFTLTPGNDEQWSCAAEPVFDRTNGSYFYTDESGVLRSAKGMTATNSSHVQ